MPTWIHPVLRAIQEDQEAEGLVPKINSVAVTMAIAKEQAGLEKRPSSIITRVLRGSVYSH